MRLGLRHFHRFLSHIILTTSIPAPSSEKDNLNISSKVVLTHGVNGGATYKNH